MGKNTGAAPIFSVVMPAFNAGKTIANAIMSIMNQSFTDWEFIIVNDGSTDDTEKAIGIFKDERIRHKRFLGNNGIVKARNAGIEIARGEYIVTQDADDLSLPNRLERCMTAIGIANPDILYHGAYINMWDKEYSAISRKYLPAPEVQYINELYHHQHLPGWPIFRKSVWEQKPFRMETQYLYDWMMYLDWYEAGFTFYALNEGLYEYVRQENSASVRFEREGKREQSLQAIIKIMKDEYGKSIDFSPTSRTQ